ncbi:hypothetical protein SH2C18_27300 [Clostridium sediminicola]|uniref:hypothetical protein n=1 Tax=Clostridium sediminicola TaxID=3114879 RepID=UPI0031F22109
MNFELINAQGIAVIDKVYKQEADLGIFIIVTIILENFIYYLKDRNLSYTSLGKLSRYFYIRQSHPILKHKDLFFSKLHKYPLVQFRENYYNKIVDTSVPDELNFINHDNKIVVFDRDLKCKIANETDVYSDIGYIHSTNHPMSMESQTYIDILKEELNGLVL